MLLKLNLSTLRFLSTLVIFVCSGYHTLLWVNVLKPSSLFFLTLHKSVTILRMTESINFSLLSLQVCPEPEYILRNLAFSERYSVSLVSTSRRFDRDSNPVSITFVTKSCLELTHFNYSKCGKSFFFFLNGFIYCLYSDPWLHTTISTSAVSTIRGLSWR